MTSSSWCTTAARKLVRRSGGAGGIVDVHPSLGGPADATASHPHSMIPPQTAGLQDSRSSVRFHPHGPGGWPSPAPLPGGVSTSPRRSHPRSPTPPAPGASSKAGARLPGGGAPGGHHGGQGRTASPGPPPPRAPIEVPDLVPVSSPPPLSGGGLARAPCVPAGLSGGFPGRASVRPWASPPSPFAGHRPRPPPRERSGSRIASFPGGGCRSPPRWSHDSSPHRTADLRRVWAPRSRPQGRPDQVDPLPGHPLLQDCTRLPGIRRRLPMSPGTRAAPPSSGGGAGPRSRYLCPGDLYHSWVRMHRDPRRSGVGQIHGPDVGGVGGKRSRVAKAGGRSVQHGQPGSPREGPISASGSGQLPGSHDGPGWRGDLELQIRNQGVVPRGSRVTTPPLPGWASRSWGVAAPPGGQSARRQLRAARSSAFIPRLPSSRVWGLLQTRSGGRDRWVRPPPRRGSGRGAPRSPSSASPAGGWPPAPATGGSPLRYRACVSASGRQLGYVRPLGVLRPPRIDVRPHAWASVHRPPPGRPLAWREHHRPGPSLKLPAPSVRPPCPSGRAVGWLPDPPVAGYSPDGGGWPFGKRRERMRHRLPLETVVVYLYFYHHEPLGVPGLRPAHPARMEEYWAPPRGRGSDRGRSTSAVREPHAANRNLPRGSSTHLFIYVLEAPLGGQRGSGGPAPRKVAAGRPSSRRALGGAPYLRSDRRPGNDGRHHVEGGVTVNDRPRESLVKSAVRFYSLAVSHRGGGAGLESGNPSPNERTPEAGPIPLRGVEGVPKKTIRREKKGQKAPPPPPRKGGNPVPMIRPGPAPPARSTKSRASNHPGRPRWPMASTSRVRIYRLPLPYREAGHAPAQRPVDEKSVHSLLLPLLVEVESPDPPLLPADPVSTEQPAGDRRMPCSPKGAAWRRRPPRMTGQR